MAGDSYRTVAAPAEAACRERSSKFLSWIYPVQTEEEIRERLDALRKKYYDATHHCYAWRLGPRGEAFRSNDDGERSGTAGKPILGQMLSNDIMRVVKEEQPRIAEQTFDNLCTMRLTIRESRAAALIEKLTKAGGSIGNEN